MEPGKACWPYILLQNQSKERWHANWDLGVPLTIALPVMCRPRCGKNWSRDLVGHWELNLTWARLISFHRYLWKHNPWKITIFKEPGGAFGGLLQWCPVYSEFCRLVRFSKSSLTAPESNRNLLGRTGLHLYGGDTNAAYFSQDENSISLSILISDSGHLLNVRSK